MSTSTNTKGVLAAGAPSSLNTGFPTSRSVSARAFEAIRPELDGMDR